MRTALNAALVDLLGETRSQVVDLLRPGPLSVAELAQRLGLTEAAVRRHVQALERDGFVVASTVRRRQRGRPLSRYALTDKARRLYPDRSADIANDVLEFLETAHGRPALLEFLRWRQSRQAERYEAALDGITDMQARATRLAELLSEDGYLAEARAVTQAVSGEDEAVDVPEGATVLQLRQGHCAVANVAAVHPELCAFEAALFQRLLGARLSRRQTIAQGAGACVCTITPMSTS